jgi:hypothetical protein
MSRNIIFVLNKLLHALHCYAQVKMKDPGPDLRKRDWGCRPGTSTIQKKNPQILFKTFASLKSGKVSLYFQLS